MIQIPIYSVVAYSNTGKTTMIEKLIPELKRRGLRVAVLKHDAHHFYIDHEGKDSWRMTRAGADVTVIASDKNAAVIENRPVPLEDLLERITNVDIIITEGCKSGPWPKIALRRSDNNKPFPLPPEECLAVMSDIPEETETPCLGLNDVSALAELIINDIATNKSKLQLSGNTDN